MGDLLFGLYGAVFLTAHYVDSSARKLFSVGVHATHKIQDAYDRKATGRISSPYAVPSTILEPYIYEPLDGPSKIRLLTLAPGQSQDAIHCTLDTVELDSSPNFEAISYCWGGSLGEQTIVCNGGSLSITKNLYDALHRFRDSDEPRTLWADAICINQMDTAERTQQVPLMRRIYAQCSQCLVWLGLHDYGDGAAAHLLLKLSKLRDLQPSPERGPDNSSEEKKPWSRYTTTPNQWTSLRKLLDRPWFIRMWTLQEIIIPLRASMFCGKYEWDVDEFLGVIKFIHDNRGEEDLGSVTNGLLQCLKIARSREERHKCQASEGQYRNLLDVLRDARERDAGDERDKVFAVLGLCEEDVARTISADYNDSRNEVYVNVAKYFLTRSSKPLRMLRAAGYIEGQNKEPVLPSWFPDWSQRISLTPSIRHFEESGKFKAGGSTQPEMRFFASPHGTEQLLLKGKIVTTLQTFIDINSSTFKEEWKQEYCPDRTALQKCGDAYFFMAMGWWMNCCRDDEYKCLQSYFLQKCHDLTFEPTHGQRLWGQFIWHEGMEPQFFRSNRREACEFWRYGGDMFWQAVSREAGPSDAAYAFKNGFSKFVNSAQEKDDDEDEAMGPFLYDLNMWTEKRKFCRAVDGGIGWVPLEAKADDVVCVFEGSELPYILRKASDEQHYLLIGHCYFHGVMHGEICQEGDWEDIVLQ